MQVSICAQDLLPADNSWRRMECCSQFIDIWVEDAVYEANARALIRVLVGQLDMNLPESTLEGRC